MGTLADDLMLAGRTLARRPGFTAIVAGTIALAIAANTAVFTVVHGVLLRPLPFRNPERLVTIDVRAPTGYEISLSIPNYRDWRDRSHVFQSFAASAGWDFTLTGRGPAEVIQGRLVIGDLFGTLGIAPFRGRAPTPGESLARPGGDAVVVLGHAFWQQRFGGDPSIIGQTLVLDARSYSVIGVLPAGVGYPSPAEAFYTPMSALARLPWDDRESSFGTRAIARLNPTVSLAAAQRDLDRVGREVREIEGRPVALPELRSLTTYFVGDVRPQLWILMCAVGFVLLIAVANVGNLLVARAEDRHREFAIRAALGAGRVHIVRLLLAEALGLALLGAVVGLGLAAAAVKVLVALQPAEVPAVSLSRIHVDPTVIVFALGLALITAFLAIVPAWRTTDLRFSAVLRVGTRTTDTSGRGLRAGLVIGETALAIVVLTGAGLMLVSLARLRHVDKGFTETGVLTAAISPDPARSTDVEHWRAFYHELRERAAHLPGVRTAALANLLPLSNRSNEQRVHPEGVPVVDETGQSVLLNVVSPEYFEALRVPVLRGRGFSALDRDGGPLVAIIDATMAQRFWPGADPIGKRITFEEDSLGQPVYRTVVGVAANVRHYELEAPSRIQAYVPLDQTYRRWGMTMRLALRTDGPPQRLASSLRDLVAQIDADAPVSDIQPLRQLVDGAVARPRAMTRVLTALGAGALALAALGLFGVVSYDVARRRREIGIRMALGASASTVVRWVGVRALRLTAAGIAFGLLAAVGLTRLLRGLLFSVNPLDPAVYGIVALVLIGVALLAAYLPARRAARVDPVTVLNTEG